MGKIYFQTRAYNAEKTLARCIESVLNQTKHSEDIVYWILDNGSTDRTHEMLQDYSKKDSRIRLFYTEINNQSSDEANLFFDLPLMIGEDDCYCTIDADDEYKLDFLEKMIPFMRDNDLDIAICGNDFVDSLSGTLSSRRVMAQEMILDMPEKYSAYFPVYHQFMRPLWGKIYRGKISRKVYTEVKANPPKWVDIGYGEDTLNVFLQLKDSKRVGIYPETLYRYYVSPKSSSYVWDSRRLESDCFLNEAAEDFLNKFGSISEQNRRFLDGVYANAVSDSISVLRSARGIKAEEKLKELRTVVDYRVTSDMMKFNNPSIQRCKKNIFNTALNFGLELKNENDDFNAALSLICPNCAPFVSVSELELYAREGALQNALFNDNMTEIVDLLLRLISKGAFTKQFDLFKIVSKFSADRGLAGDISDTKFVKKYSDIYFMLWQKKYVQALDRMTEIILKEKAFDEMFLQVYLTLAAMLESVDEFVLGKVKLASYYCEHNKTEECRVVLDDFADMGVEDNDEITAIKAKLNNK